MMKRKIIYLSLLMAILVIVLYACQDDIFEKRSSEKVSSLTVAGARYWYEVALVQHDLNRVALRSANSDEILAPAPNWNIAEMSNNQLWNVVELPWEYEGGEKEEVIAIAEVWEYAKANNITPESVTKLVVMENRRTGEVYVFKMKIAPDLAYMLNNSGRLQDNKYLTRESDLSGFVMFYTLENRFVNGYWHKDGIVLRELIQSNAANNTGPRAIRSGDVDYDKDLPEFDFLQPKPLCPLWGRRPQLGVQESSPPGNGGGGPGSNGGGGAPGANTGPAPALPPVNTGPNPHAPKASLIFNTSHLTEDEARRLERMLNEMLENCLGQGLYNELAQILNGRILSLDLIIQRKSTYDFNTKKMTLGLIEADFSTLFHEMFHALQDFFERPNDWTAAAMNREAEAQFAQLHHIQRSPQSDVYDDWIRHFTTTQTGQAIAHIGILFVCF
ncbi:MAG: hypothetical protein LBI15_12325 [Dysgonamonadaceae bacterium]|jgi:hypothetical protein|nr:hypothetical protein [Dysgonamonadaceae bacterium]